MQTRSKEEPDFGAFLAAYEGVDTGDFEGEMETEIDAWNATEEAPEPKFESFFTGYGPVDGGKIVNFLNNQATMYAMTSTDPFEQPPNEPASLFHFQSRYDSETFQGIMPDTGAAGISTAGENQVKALQKKIPSTKIDTSTAGQHRVRFGDNPESISLGTVAVETPFGSIDFQVVPANTPFLFCLSDMDKYGVYLNNILNILVYRGKGYPIIRKWGHPWFLLDDLEKTIAWNHLTETELRQLYRRFGHPVVERLYKVLTRAGYDDLEHEVIEKINKFCHQCQMHGGNPGRFRFTLHDDVDFNYRVLVDVMYLDGKPVIHAIDEATSFQAARFLQNMTAKATWNTIRAM